MHALKGPGLRRDDVLSKLFMTPQGTRTPADTAGMRSSDSSMRLLTLIFTLLFVQAASALTLFSVDLNNATRDELRTAVKNSGIDLISEAGDDKFFDHYEANALIPGAQNLYLGFVKETGRWAFIEYDFPGLRQDHMLQLLRAKYGKPGRSRAEFISDAAYQWSVDGVEITLYHDWSAYRTRLIYRNSDNLMQLQREYQQFIEREERPLPEPFAY